MECPAKPANPTSNISEIATTFAQISRLKSIGVLPSEYSGHFHGHHHQVHHDNENPAAMAEVSIDHTEEEAKFEIQTKSENECGDLEILKLFDEFSLLKLAYVQLQEAHIAYNPEQIKAADELVVSQLESLCKIKHDYKEKQFKKSKTLSACSTVSLAKIKAQERLQKKLKSQVKAKHVEILNLRRTLHNLKLKNTKLSEILKQKLHCSSFEDVVKSVSKAVHDFSKPLIALMKASGWNLDLAANAIQDSVLYSKRCHKKYMFEAYIVRKMFYGLSLESSCNIDDDIASFNDPINALTQQPDSNFSKFCRTKYLLVVHPKMEESFFGNFDHRTLVTSKKHPRTQFYQAFVKMARWVWLLQGILASSEDGAEIFGVKRGSSYTDVYMESVEELYEEETVILNGELKKLRVEFMIMPGFRIGENLVRSRVYVSKSK